MAHPIYQKNEECFCKMNKDALRIIRLDKSDDEYFEITGEFIKIWDLIDGIVPSDVLVERFAAIIEEEVEDIEEDVEAFLKQLLDYNLIIKLN